MKVELLCLLFLITIAVATVPELEYRLIAFNETYRKWMPYYQIEEMVSECGKDHGGFMDITDHRDLSPSGLKDSVKALLAASPFPDGPTHQSTVKPLIALISTDKMKEYNDKLSSYHTRYYSTETGKQAAQWIHQKFEDNKNGRTDITISYFEHTFKQPSVIARIQGTGDYAKEVVIVSAHEDSVSGGSQGRAPGADDDASGTCTVLELFRVFASSGFIPDRSIEFHTYAAEEVGLRGSQDVAEAYQEDGIAVYAQMQLDMTFYVKPQTTETFGIITDYVSEDLTTFLQTLVPAYSTLGVTTSQCGYGCSDHASWYSAGYASCFPFESSFGNLNPKIHSSSDTIEILDLDHGLEFAKVATGFLVELSLVD